MRIVLASKSPRRREILSMLGVQFDVVTADTDEKSEITDPAKLVEELALRKGRAVRELLKKQGEWDDSTLIIASDTVVATDSNILGKPQNEQDAARMLRTLEGGAHHVISGVALFWDAREIAAHDKTTVHFAPMSEEEILWYAKSGEPLDKAGAYGIQDLGGIFVEKIDGDYYNGVGLPLESLCRILRDDFDYDVLAERV